MIVTIDDYRGKAEPEASSSSEQIKDEDDDSPFTVARAGLLKLKLQALNNVLARTPLAQHRELRLEETVQGVLPRTYVSGSEELYFIVKDLSWPSKIPEVFINAYKEVCECRPFTNKYIPRNYTRGYRRPLGSATSQFAPTFSMLRPLLRQIDASCCTKLSNFFDISNDRSGYFTIALSVFRSNEVPVNPFAFAKLPAELRLHIYDQLYPCSSFVHLSAKVVGRFDERLPTCLDIMRVSKAIHAETTEHFFKKSILLIKACKMPVVGGSKDLSVFTLDNYAALIMSMSPDVRENITTLEIQVRPGSFYDMADIGCKLWDNSPLHRVCTALPNLAVVVISFTIRKKRRDSAPIHIRATLDWIRTLLPPEGLQIAWDLTHHWGISRDSARLREALMSDPMTRELIERDGTLELAKSATATREDLQKWSEVSDVVLEAIRQC